MIKVSSFQDSLNLNSKNLQQLPEELWNCIGLIKLELSKNLLKDLPPNIVQLQNLKFLDLSANQLANLPNELCHLYFLLDINLAKNKLTQFLPNCDLTFKSLTSINLDGNCLTEIPSVLLRSPKLEKLSLASNRIKAMPSTSALNLRILNLNTNNVRAVQLIFVQQLNAFQRWKQFRLTFCALVLL